MRPEALAREHRADASGRAMRRLARALLVQSRFPVGLPTFYLVPNSANRVVTQKLRMGHRRPRFAAITTIETDHGQYGTT